MNSMSLRGISDAVIIIAPKVAMTLMMTVIKMTTAATAAAAAAVHALFSLSLNSRAACEIHNKSHANIALKDQLSCSA